MAVFDAFLSSLREEFGEQQVGTKFESFCKWYLETDPEWSRIVDKVWLWVDYPNKWQNQDLGTDLVFRDKNGLIWAVQAKCYSEHRATTKSDVNSFLADTSRPDVDRRLWMQTSNLMASTAQKTLVGQEKPTTVLRLDDFRESDLEYPNSFADLYKAKQRPKPKPEPHQEEAISAVKEALKDNDRGQLIMACGTGKTFTTLWIKEALNAESTLVLLPSLSLLSQTMREWAWAGNTEFEILNVCSDQSVGRQSEDMSVNDAPFPVTSDPDEIASFLQKQTPKVVFCTYQSSPLITDAQLIADKFAFDLAIADEAHRCAGKADAGFATILDGNKIRAAKRLFTTATPRYFGKSVVSKAEGRGLEVVGMNDESIFGPVVHQLTFGEAIQRDLLTDYQVVVVGVDNAMVKSLIDERELLALSDENHTDAESLAAKIGLLKACKDYDLKRVISFHSRVKGAKEFSKEFADIAGLIDPAQRPSGVFLTDYVSGDMNAGDRKNKIDRLKVLEGFDRGILANARCLAEGVDVPSLDGVAFLDPRGSQVEIIQAVGRAIRKVRGLEVQKKGTIVIPVFIQDGDTVEESLEESNFRPVWDILKALRAHDEVLADVLDGYRSNLGKRPGASNRGSLAKIVFDLPVSVGSDFSDALRTFVVEQSTESWEFWYGLLEAYKEREGDCMVPQSYVTEKGARLGTWASKQREALKRNALSAEKKQRLDALDFVWDPLDWQWEKGFEALRFYHKAYGNSNVPTSYQTDAGYKLGVWVDSQRQKSKSNSLLAENKQRLDALDFVWEPLAYQWEEGFEELAVYQQEHGHCQMSAKYKTGTGFNLGQWTSVQRVNWKNGNLSSERKQRLDALGFIWDVIAERWEKGFRELTAYHQAYGHIKVPSAYKTASGFNLGFWLSNQRQLAANNKLSTERKQRIEDLGSLQNPEGDSWERGFEELSTFKLDNRHCNAPIGYVTNTGFKLGAWVTNQRKLMMSSNLSEEKVQRLDKLGFVWDLLAEQWEHGYRELSAFHKANGNCRVPSSFTTATGFKLGGWLSRQRQAVKKNELSLERKLRLESLGLVLGVLNEQWEEGFRELTAFHQSQGHSKVPQSYRTESGYKLGQWCSVQRRNFAKNKLSVERKDRLDKLNFAWDQLAEAWEEGFRELDLFQQTNGHCKFTATFETETGFKLGAWAHKQRQSYKKSTLTDERKQRLDAIGFVWDLLAQQWEEGFNELTAFHKEHGHCRTTYSFITGTGFKLGQWVSRQRDAYGNNKLSRERKQRLEALGFVWSLE